MDMQKEAKSAHESLGWGAISVRQNKPLQYERPPRKPTLTEYVAVVPTVNS